MGWVLPVRGVVTLLVLLAILLLTKPVSSGSCWLFKPIDSLTGQGPLRINGLNMQEDKEKGTENTIHVKGPFSPIQKFPIALLRNVLVRLLLE